MVWGPYRGVIDQVHDGDTVYVKLDLGFDLTVYARVRLRGQASNELYAADGSGKAARDYAQMLLPVGTTVSVMSLSWDKYGARVDGSIFTASGDFTSQMIAAGYAVAWDGTGRAPVVPYPPVPIL